MKYLYIFLILFFSCRSTKIDISELDIIQNRKTTEFYIKNPDSLLMNPTYIKSMGKKSIMSKIEILKENNFQNLGKIIDTKYDESIDIKGKLEPTISHQIFIENINVSYKLVFVYFQNKQREWNLVNIYIKNEVPTRIDTLETDIP